MRLPFSLDPFSLACKGFRKPTGEITQIRRNDVTPDLSTVYREAQKINFGVPLRTVRTYVQHPWKGSPQRLPSYVSKAKATVLFLHQGEITTTEKTKKKFRSLLMFLARNSLFEDSSEREGQSMADRTQERESKRGWQFLLRHGSTFRSISPDGQFRANFPPPPIPLCSAQSAHPRLSFAGSASTSSKSSSSCPASSAAAASPPPSGRSSSADAGARPPNSR